MLFLFNNIPTLPCLYTRRQNYCVLSGTTRWSLKNTLSRPCCFCSNLVRQKQGPHQPGEFLPLSKHPIITLLISDSSSFRSAKGNDLATPRRMLLVHYRSVMRRAGRTIKAFPLNPDTKCCWWSVQREDWYLPNKYRGLAASVSRLGGRPESCEKLAWMWIYLPCTSAFAHSLCKHCKVVKEMKAMGKQRSFDSSVVCSCSVMASR